MKYLPAFVAVYLVAVCQAVADPGAELCFPENNATGVNAMPSAYAKMIEPHLGVPPIVDCGAGVEQPIFVDGSRFQGDPGLHGCDNPSLQVGDCMSGSSVQRYPGVAADGTPLHDVVWTSFCRHDGRDNDFGWDIPDSVQMIGYNRFTGATAFFESGDNKDWTYIDPDTNRLMGRLPGIDEPAAFDKAYSTPKDVQCVACHQADPFVHNSFIDGATLAAAFPGAPEEPVVPRTGGIKRINDTPYFVIGGSHWDMRTIHIEDNGCLECHRMGMKTVEEFVGDHWDPNAHMPPRDPGSLAADYAALVACWIDGPEATPGCDWVIPPAGDCPSQIVDESYPFKARFNRPQQELFE